MQYSKTGLELTEGFEGCKLVGYPDIRGIPTVGFGHTGPNVKIGMVITHDQANTWLMDDMRHAENTVNGCVRVPLTQNEYDSLCDFVYNAGSGAFEGSTLLKLLNAGDYNGAANEFEKWDHASGKVVAGLLRRREAEQHEFTS